jgi:hypothetical protein
VGAKAAEHPSTLGFTEPEHIIRESHQVAPGYQADLLIRWGDKVLPDAPPFDPSNLTSSAQEKQFGYNCGYIGLCPCHSEPIIPSTACWA